MTENNKGKPMGEKLPHQLEGVDDEFDKISELSPMRDEIDLKREDMDDGRGDIETRMAGHRKPSDLEVADKRLFPDLGYRHLNILQMARVFPDTYTPLSRILTKDLMRNSKMRLAQAIAYVDTALSIAIDGEGRIDEIVVARGISEHKSDEEKKKIGFAP